MTPVPPKTAMHPLICAFSFGDVNLKCEALFSPDFSTHSCLNLSSLPLLRPHGLIMCLCENQNSAHYTGAGNRISPSTTTLAPIPSQHPPGQGLVCRRQNVCSQTWHWPIFSSNKGRKLIFFLFLKNLKHTMFMLAGFCVWQVAFC